MHHLPLPDECGQEAPWSGPKLVHYELARR